MTTANLGMPRLPSGKRRRSRPIEVRKDSTTAITTRIGLMCQDLQPARVLRRPSVMAHRSVSLGERVRGFSRRAARESPEAAWISTSITPSPTMTSS